MRYVRHTLLDYAPRGLDQSERCLFVQTRIDTHSHNINLNQTLLKRKIKYQASSKFNMSITRTPVKFYQDILVSQNHDVLFYDFTFAL